MRTLVVGAAIVDLMMKIDVSQRVEKIFRVKRRRR